MTPGARAQGAIDVIDMILSAWMSETRIPSDKLLQNYFASHRYIGSKDRGQISAYVYWVLRHKASLDWWINQFDQRVHGRSYIFATLVLKDKHPSTSFISLCSDSKYSPPPATKDEEIFIDGLQDKSIYHPSMSPEESLNYPTWLDEKLRRAFGTKFDDAMRAMNEQAPTDIRVNTIKATRENVLKAMHELEYDAAPTPTSPIGIRLSKRFPVFVTDAFKKGWFEVQDEGSQIVAQLVQAEPGHRVIDFCAGAGGKTLAIAASMQNKGRILAWDKSKKRLSQIAPRLRRAGVDNVEVHEITSETDQYIKRHKNSADRVLVDVPCSGTGTWRRNPDLKWRFNDQDLKEVRQQQEAILKSAARLVKQGGRLIYATCSVLKEENEDQIDQFLNEFPNFRVVCARKIWDKDNSYNQDDVVSYLSLTPHEDGVDGFFAAVLEKVEKRNSSKLGEHAP